MICFVRINVYIGRNPFQHNRGGRSHGDRRQSSEHKREQHSSTLTDNQKKGIMGAFVFDKCCFCIELKTGCFIIAYLSLIGYICLAVTSIIGLAFGGIIAADHGDSDNQQAGVVVMIGAGILLLITLFLLTFIIVLLVGLHKNKPGHVKAYLIYACIFVVLSILGLIGGIVSGKTTGSSIGQNIFNILLTIYFILVIRSQYLVMKGPERGPAIYSAA